jgi:hypothetical protein
VVARLAAINGTREWSFNGGDGYGRDGDGEGVNLGAKGTRCGMELGAREVATGGHGVWLWPAGGSALLGVALVQGRKKPRGRLGRTDGPKGKLGQLLWEKIGGVGSSRSGRKVEKNIRIRILNFDCCLYGFKKENLNDFKPEFWIFSKIGVWTLVKDLDKINLKSRFGIF